MIRTHINLALVSLLTVSVIARADDFEASLEQAQEAARNHRYHEVIELLTPFNSANDPEIRYITAAEIGRAQFHLGHYQPAHSAFRQAVQLRPQRVETAMYFEATSFLLGDRVQALLVFEELLKSGATDLYLAVTLPGERRFLADPGVQTLLERHSIALELDAERGILNGVPLGSQRTVVASEFAAPSSESSTGTLSATAGPATIWAFEFDADDRLSEAAVHADNLTRYTPYRLVLVGHPKWRPTPADSIAALGSPEDSQPTDDGGLRMTWRFSTHRLILQFTPPREPRPPGIAQGSAVLRFLHLTTAN